MKALAFCICWLTAVRVLAVGPASGFEKLKSIDSPEGHVTADFYFRDADTKRQIWLRYSTSDNEPELLYEYERDADLLFSPDERWIVVNDRLGSNVSEVRLFKQIRGLKYAEEEQAHVTEKAWRFLATHYGLPKVPEMFHRYSQVIRWAPDSRAFMVVLCGHEDIDQRVDPWTCVFDLRSFEPSLDLSLMNRDAVRIGGKTLNDGGLTPNTASQPTPKEGAAER